MKENSIEEDIKIVENILHKGYTMSILHPNTNIKECEIKAIEHILSDYKRVLKENEGLRKSNKIYALQGSNIKLEIYIKDNYLSKQKVKDKIEEYKNMLKTCNKAKDIDRIKAINERISELQELLEGRK